MTPLPNARIELTTAGYNPAEFTFSILGAIPPGGTDPVERLQVGDPVFTRDQAGNYLQSGVVYQLVIQHDTYAPEGDLVQAQFSDDGKSVKTTTPEELAPIKPGNGLITTPGWDAVCHVDNETDQVVRPQNLERPLGLFETVFRGLAALVATGTQNKAGQPLERLAIVGPSAVKAYLNGEVEAYNVSVTTNTCKQIAGIFYNPNLPSVPATLPFYADGDFISNITATIALPVQAAQLGLPLDALIGFVWPVLDSLQNNYNHTFEIRHPLTGKALATFYSPGNCGIQTDPTPIFIIDAQYEELPLPVETNPPPQVTNPIDDVILRGNGALYYDYRSDDITDTDALDFFGESYDGSHVIDFPSGVSYDPAANNGHGRVNVSPSVPDGTSFTVRHRATDTAKQQAAYTRLFYVVRTSATPDPLPYVTQKEYVGTIYLYEGGAIGEWYILQTYNTGTTEVYKGGGTPSWLTGYPNGAGLSKFDSATGKWTAQIPANSIEGQDDITLLQRFTFPDGNSLDFKVTGVNTFNAANHPPIVQSPRGTQYVTQGKPFSMAMPFGAQEFYDQDGDALTYDLEVSNDDGQTYTNILPSWITDGASSTTGTAPVSSGQMVYKFRAVASDGHGGVAYDAFSLVAQVAQPTGTESCPNYAKLTPNQFDALPQIVTYEYNDPNTPANGRSYTVRAFSSRAEAMQIIPTRGQAGSKCGFDFNKCSSATANIGAVLYNDNRIEHENDHLYWPIEAGYWGYSLNLPQAGTNGNFILLQTNACGNIISRETIIIYAN